MFKVIDTRDNTILTVKRTEREAKAYARKVDAIRCGAATRIERLQVTSTDHRTTRITNHN